jgi:hypothetical protein
VERLPPLLGRSFFVKVEQFFVHPNICAVIGNKNGDVADDADALFVGIIPQCCPLAVKNELLKGLKFNFLLILLMNLLIVFVSRFLNASGHSLQETPPCWSLMAIKVAKGASHPFEHL